jgi:formylglycine-generating enzyme required for sulfatase activity
MLPASQPVFKDTSHLKCSGHATWTDTAASLEASPINCVNWYEAFAFCIWDGGRLPTEAEWEYAAAGGAENRLYPWGSNGTEPLPANYNANHGVAALPVGSEPSGNGRWGHADLAGSMSEWNLDYWGWYAADGASCDNCANLIASSSRAVRGGHWDSWWPRLLRAANRGSISAASPSASAGLRCARAIVGP